MKDIAERQDITLKYLKKIIPQLTKSGLVRSYRGNNGGYQLTRRPEEYTAGEIIRALEGSLAPIACIEDEPNRCPRQKECSTVKFWKGFWDVVNEYMDSVTLADLIADHQEGQDAGAV